MMSSDPEAVNTFRLSDSFYPIKYNLAFDVSEVSKKVADVSNQSEAIPTPTSVDFPSCCEIFIKQKTKSSESQFMSDVLELHALSLEIERIEVREIEGTPIVINEWDNHKSSDSPISPLFSVPTNTSDNAGVLSGSAITQSTNTGIVLGTGPYSTNCAADSSLGFTRNTSDQTPTCEIADNNNACDHSTQIHYYAPDEVDKVCLASCCFTESVKGTTYAKSARNQNPIPGVNVNNNEGFIPASFTPCPVHETIHIRCVDGLPFPQQFSMKVYYRAQVSLDYMSDRLGTFLCHREEDDGFISTLLEPTLARTLFPCFDEPCIKAAFQVAVTTCGRKYTALSCSRKAVTIYHKNMPRDGMVFQPNIPTSTPDPSQIGHNVHVASSQVPITVGQCDKITTLFHVSAPIPTYLVSFCVGRFHVLETQTKGGMHVRVFSAMGKSSVTCEGDDITTSQEPNNTPRIDDTTNHSSRGWFALDLLKKAVEFYEVFFDFRLPVRKLDMVGIPNFRVLGMENWGLINMSQNYMLVDERTSVERRQRIARLIGHEVGHQWFGNLITIEWWNYVWLKEGFCRFLEFYFISATFPEWQIWNEFFSQITDVALQKDCIHHETHPVQCDDSPTSDPRKIFNLFDTISYGKGASILKMTASILGEKGLSTAMRNLVHTHAYGNFNNADFMTCAQKQYEHQRPWAYSVPTENTNVIPSLIRVPHRIMGPNIRNCELDSLITSWVCAVSHPLLFVTSSTPVKEETSDTVQKSCDVTCMSIYQYKMRDLRLGIIPSLIKEKQFPSIEESYGSPVVCSSMTNKGCVSVRGCPSQSSSLKENPKRSDVTNPNEIDQSSLLSELKSGKVENTPESKIFLPNSFEKGALTGNQIYYNPSTYFEPSSFSVPVRLMYIKEGQTADSNMILLDQPFVQVEHNTTSIAGKASVFLCNSGSTGVYRVDYDTSLWQDIFSVAAFLPSIDRLCITVNLFRFRTVHFGVTSKDDLFDRCTLLPQWLWEFSSSHPAQMQATIWACIAENLLPYVIQLRNEPVCAEELSEFIMALFFPLYKQGMLGFFPTENKREFQANKMITTDTCNNIMEILAFSRCPLFHTESKVIFEWAMRSLVVISDDDVSVSDHSDASSGLSCLLPSVPTTQCVDLIASRGRFDANNDTHLDAARLAFTFLAEGGYQREWRLMLEVTLALLPDVYWKLSLDAITGIKEKEHNNDGSCIGPESDRVKNTDSYPNNNSPIEKDLSSFSINFTVSIKQSVMDDQELTSRWIRTLVPAVAAFDDYMVSTPLALYCLQLNRITNRMAISFITNTNMFEELLSISGSKLSFNFAYRFLQLGAKFCGSARIADKLKALAEALSASCNLSTLGDKTVSEFLQQIECNVAWTKYAAPHYASYFNSIRKDMCRITKEVHKGSSISFVSQAEVRSGDRYIIRAGDDSIGSEGFDDGSCLRPRGTFTELQGHDLDRRTDVVEGDNDDDDSNRSGVSI